MVYKHTTKIVFLHAIDAIMIVRNVQEEERAIISTSHENRI